MVNEVKACDIPNTDPLLDSSCNGTDKNSEVKTPVANQCCPKNDDCSPFEISENDDTCVIDSYVVESINIGGAVLNVHKLLGVHEQGKLQDLTGNGTPISGGFHPNFPPENAFDKLITEWKSSQVGQAIMNESYIGYDFGEIRLDDGRLRYGVETYVKKDISTIRIKQSCKSINRATKIRIERSDNNDKWYGVTLLELEDCDGLLTLNFRRTVPSRFWRVRVVEFNGGDSDFWGVQALQLIDYEATHISNIQDKVFLENRDRDYDEFSTRLKGSYQPVESQSFLSKWGYSGGMNGSQLFLEVSFSALVQALGRPFVMGDIVQLPSETQYSAQLRPIKKYMEVTDISWSAGGFTPSWQPLIQRVIIQPVMASQETQDILGKLTPSYDTLNTSDVDDGMYGKPFQDIADIDMTINAKQNTQVPEKGTDYADIQKMSDEYYEWADEHPEYDASRIDRVRHEYGIDGMPPNGEPYTEGDEHPTNPKDGDYHRLTYTKIGKGIPTRLERYSTIKGRWVYLETDRRAGMQTNTILQDFTDPDKSTVTPLNSIDDEL